MKNKTNVTYIDTRVTVSNNVTVANLTFGINIDKLPCLNALGDAGVNLNDMFDKYYNYRGIADYTDDNGVTTKQLVYQTIGRAKLKDEDRTLADEIIGERLAISEAQKKAFSIANRLYKDLFNETINRIVTPIVNFTRGTENTVHDCDEHRKHIVKEYYEE